MMRDWNVDLHHYRPDKVPREIFIMSVFGIEGNAALQRIGNKKQ